MSLERCVLLAGGWIASIHGSEQYLQVDFEAIYDVTELKYTNAIMGWHTRSFRLAKPSHY